MGRIVCIDYGKVRCGIAVSDPLQIIATALGVRSPKELIYFLKQYLSAEPVDAVVIGYTTHEDGSDTDSTKAVEKFIRNFQKVFPQVPIHTIEEAYSSQRAAAQIAQMQLSKKKRETKGLIDEVAATLLLQDYLESQKTSL